MFQVDGRHPKNCLLSFLALTIWLANPSVGFTVGLAPAIASAGRATSTRRGNLSGPAQKTTCLALRSQDCQETFTGGNELALRIMITKNRANREAADRAYIPMDVAVRWARTLNLWNSREKWEEWIEENKYSNPFIPEDPEAYYTNRGVWLGWRYWLGGE